MWIQFSLNFLDPIVLGGISKSFLCCFLIRQRVALQWGKLFLCCSPTVEEGGREARRFLFGSSVADSICCIYVGLTTFVIVFMLFLLYWCIKTQRWQVKNKVCCGGMICFLNKHELQLNDWDLFFVFFLFFLTLRLFTNTRNLLL